MLNPFFPTVTIKKKIMLSIIDDFFVTNIKGMQSIKSICFCFYECIQTEWAAVFNERAALKFKLQYYKQFGVLYI